MKPFKWYADIVRLAISALLLTASVALLVGPVTVIDYSGSKPTLDTFLRFFGYVGSVSLSFVFLFFVFRDKTKSHDPGDGIAAGAGFVLSTAGVVTLYATLGDLWADRVIYWVTQILLAVHVWGVMHWWIHRDDLTSFDEIIKDMKENNDGRP